MRYVQLRAFHHVATAGGFSRAAEALHLTQPAISDQVRRLEEDYDVLLFNRIRKQVTPTEAGERLLAITRRLFDLEREAQTLLSENRALRAGTLRIVADSAHHVLPALIAFRQRYPAVRVSLRSGNTETVIAALHAFDADIGVLAEVPPRGDFQTLSLGQSPIVAFAARGHPAAALGRAPLAELAAHPLVLREDGSKTRAKLEQAAAAQDLVLEPQIVAEGREAVREIVASGAGLGFVSAAEFGHDPRLVRIDIADAPGLTMDEALICLGERRAGRLVNAFFEIAGARGA